MQIDKGMEKIGDLFSAKKAKKMPTYVWQDLALRVIKELSIPEFKRGSVFKICKLKPRVIVEKALNDTKELCHDGESWKYFFKVIGAKNDDNYKRKFIDKYPTPKGAS